LDRKQAVAAFLGPFDMTPQDYVSLNRAPRLGAGPRPPGTKVTAYAYDLLRLPEPLARLTPDHLYVEYDDGQEQLIARGGPSREGLGLAAGHLRGDLSVAAKVGSARESRDYRRGGRVMFRGFLPHMTAQQAAGPARRHAAGVNRGGNAYLGDQNSNTFASDVVEDTFGVPIGDGQTWGSGGRLGHGPKLRSGVRR